MRHGGEFLTFGMSKQLTLCLAGVAMARFYYTALHRLLQLIQMLFLSAAIPNWLLSPDQIFRARAGIFTRPQGME